MTPVQGIGLPMPDAQVVEVADGTFAYVQHDGGWWVNSTGFVAGNTGVLAIDTCATERRTRALLSAIDETTSSKRVRTLVNTHHHGDHTHGNALFDGATIVGHERCRAGVLADPVLENPPPVFDPTPNWGVLEKAPPTVTFTDRLDIWVDDIEVRLCYVGGPAHTDGDIVVWIPERDVLFTGDMVFNGGTPLLMSGSVTGYLTALEFVRSIGAGTLVPGHGPPCGPEVIASLERYTTFVLDAAKAGLAAGLTPLGTALDLDLGDFAGLNDPERIVLNLHRAYLDLAGGEAGDIDYNAAFADAIAYNGGRRLTCTV